MEKVKINIVYSPGTGEPSKVYENDHGEIWNSNVKDYDKINIGMGWYSIRKPTEADCLLVVEPFCVLDRDYDPEFGKKFKYIFTWANKAFTDSMVKDKVILIQHPTYQTPTNSSIIESWPSWESKNKQVVFIANNKSSKHHSELYSFRLILADLLHEHSDFDVNWYAQIPIKRPYFKGLAHNKEEILKNAQFSVCTENSYDPVYSHNYFTEKMPDVWKSSAVPIYFGCHNIDDLGISKDLYIDLRDFCFKNGSSWDINKDGIINKMKSFNKERYESYRNNIKTELLDNNKLNNLTLFSSAYEVMINTFNPKTSV